MSAKSLTLDPVVQLLQRPLLGYLYYLTRNRDLAAELSQHTWLRALEHASRVREPASMQPWLFTIARHLVVDQRRARRPTVPLEPSPDEGSRPAPALKSATPSPFEITAAAEESGILREAIRLLPAHLRAVCVLHYFSGLTLAEVADRTRVPIGTARSRLHRALAALRLRVGARLSRPASAARRRRRKAHGRD